MLQSDFFSFLNISLVIAKKNLVIWPLNTLFFISINLYWFKPVVLITQLVNCKKINFYLFDQIKKSSLYQNYSLHFQCETLVVYHNSWLLYHFSWDYILSRNNRIRFFFFKLNYYLNIIDYYFRIYCILFFHHWWIVKIEIIKELFFLQFAYKDKFLSRGFY